MIPHPLQAAHSTRTHLLTGIALSLLLVGCGGGSGGGGTGGATGAGGSIKDSGSPSPDLPVVTKDGPSSTGGAQGTPDMAPDLVSSTGGAGGSPDGNLGTGGAVVVGLDARDTGPDAAPVGPEAGPDVAMMPDVPAVDGAADLPASVDGRSEVYATEAGSGVDGGPALCLAATSSVGYTLPELKTIAWDKNGKLATAGTFFSTTPAIGGTAVTNQGSADMFVAGIDPATGNASWVLTAGDDGDQYATNVATSSDNVVGVIGNFNGSMELVTGSQLSCSTCGPGAFIDYIAGIDATTGVAKWAIPVDLGRNPTGLPMLGAIAGHPAKDYFVVCGSTSTNAKQLGITGLTPSGRDVVVAALKASDGSVLWAKAFGGAMDQFCSAAAIDDDGNVLLAGQYAGTLDFGNGALTPAPTATSDAILWVAKLNGATGATISAHGFGANGKIVPSAIAADAQGNALLAGATAVSVTFGTTKLTPLGLYDSFVAKFDSSLTPLWARRWGSASSSSYSKGIATDSSGNVVTVGQFNGTVDVGPATTVLKHNSTANDVLVARLDGATGATTCAIHYGDSAPLASQTALAVVVNRLGTGTAANRMATVGSFVGTIDFGPPTFALSAGGTSSLGGFLLLSKP